MRAFREFVEAVDHELRREHHHERGGDLEEAAQVHLAAVARPQPRDPCGEREPNRTAPRHVGEVAVERERDAIIVAVSTPSRPTMNTAKAKTAHQPAEACFCVAAPSCPSMCFFMCLPMRSMFKVQLMTAAAAIHAIRPSRAGQLTLALGQCGIAAVSEVTAELARPRLS
jgi:hypothetical protein